METRICKQCGIEKPLSEYYKGKGYKDGIRPVCKKCLNTKTMESRDPDHYRTYMRDYMRDYRNED